MALLESHDELGLPWDDWADGRVHRLVKGRDFLQSADLLEQAAENAGRRLNKVPRIVKEIRFGNVFVWVQFADFQITLGEPCPCGSDDLRRVTIRYAECASCKATLEVLEPRIRKERTIGGAAESSEDATLILALLGEESPRPKSAPRPKGRAGGDKAAGSPREPARDPRTDLTRLGAFTRINLFADARDERRERLYGHARRGEQTCLLVVDVPLVADERIADTAYPGGWRHAVWSVPVAPFGDVVRLELLTARAPELYIEDPLAEPGTADADETQRLSGLPEPIPPPDRLAAFEDVTLTPHGGRKQKKGERLVGHGRTAAGEAVMLTVRYRLKDGQRADDPARPGEALHTVRAVPVEPFGSVIDLEALTATDPTPQTRIEPSRRAGDGKKIRRRADASG